MKTRVRAGLAGALLGAALLAAVPGATETRIRFVSQPIIDFAPLQVSIAKGFFKEEGLEIDSSMSQGGAAAIPALAAGQIEMAASNIISIVLAEKQGLGFQIFAPASSTGDALPDIAGMVVKKGSAIKSGKDLEGKKVAVNTRNNIIWLFARAWIAKTGGDPDKATYLEVPFPQMIDAVKGGRVDAAFAIEPFRSPALAEGSVELIGWPYSETMKRIPVSQFIASKKYLAANPGTIEKFMRAYYKGIDWLNANKGTDEGRALIAGYTRLKPEQLKTIAIPTYYKTVDVPAIEAVVRLMQIHKLIDGPIDVKGMLYKTAVEEVK